MDLVRKALVSSALGAVCFLLLVGSACAQAQPSMSIAISSPTGYVGSKLTISGSGFPASTSLTLEWNSANANWVVASIPGSAGESPPQVTGLNIVPFEKVLGTATTNASGSFSTQIVVPPDFGQQHIVQAYAANGTAFAAKATYNLEPEFSVSSTSGPAGSPITITGTGMGDGLYSTNYHVYWDNNYVGYATAINSQGSTSFTIYASGTPGTHELAIYQGYPGPGYLNAEQIPPASATQSYFPPGCVVMVSCTIPYYVNYTVTSPDPPAGTSSGMAISGSIAFAPLLLAAVAMVGGSLFLSRQEPARRRAITRTIAVVVVIVIIAIAGVALFSTMASSASSASSSSSQTSSAPLSLSTSTSTTTQSISFTPVATTNRPTIVVPVLHNATTGPRITASPDIVSVGSNITVTGAGFAPGATLPITWATRQGSNLLGYKLVQLPLRNVTADSTGAFTFTMKVHSDVGGLHFISAGNLTENSNATVFLQRTGTISATQGPAGSKIVISFVGVGWDYNTNIMTVDYDNSYIGYGCGFNTGGNVTITIFAAGAPGIHDIDVYPSVWWGPSSPTNQLAVIYRYPLLTPQDHPELMPSFHFTYLITGPGTTG